MPLGTLEGQRRRSKTEWNSVNSLGRGIGAQRITFFRPSSLLPEYPFCLCLERNRLGISSAVVEFRPEELLADMRSGVSATT